LSNVPKLIFSARGSNVGEVRSHGNAKHVLGSVFNAAKWVAMYGTLAYFALQVIVLAMLIFIN
jgi:hypothetical protein